MVEHIKVLRSNLERLRFSDVGLLHETDIEIVDPRAVEELAIGITKVAHRTRSECVCVEESVVWIAWIGDVYLTYKTGLIRVRTSCQREIIGALADRDWETSGKANDARYVPALRKALGCVREGFVEGKCPSIAEYEVVGGVGGRQGPGETSILKIHPLS